MRLDIFARLAPGAYFPAPRHHLHTVFPRALYRMRVFAPSSDWFTALFTLVVIGQTKLLLTVVFLL